MPPRHRDDDEAEDELSYLPGSGPSLDVPEFFDPNHAPPGFVTAFWNPYEVKHRRRTSRAQLIVLESEFEHDPKPNADKRRSLAAQLNMTPRAIQVWFQNRRAKIKAIKNKIPGGRGMPKLKPGEKAAARAAAAAAREKEKDQDKGAELLEDKDNEADLWVELTADESPLTSPDGGTPCEDRAKPQFTIAVPDPLAGPSSAVSGGPPSPQSELLAPPSAASMLRRGSAPAPLQGIHRARYSVFNRAAEQDAIPASPISPLDSDIAPLRRASTSAAPNLGRRPSLPDSHLRLPSHPYYPHSGAPRMQRRGGLLSPVPDVGQEQEQAPYGLPTALPPAPTMRSSRMYRALPPGMGATAAAHDLPTQLPARPVYGSSNSHAPTRPFAGLVAGPLPAPDFSFGAPEPGHGDAFNRVMQETTNPDFNHSNPDVTNEYNDYANPNLWDARTRFGSMASIASDVTGVSVSSTQATSISSGVPTATECGPADGHHGRFFAPVGFQPDVRRASCPGEFLHQFSGMGVSSEPMRPSPLGRSLTIAPDTLAHPGPDAHSQLGITTDSRLVQDAKSLCSPTFPPGHVDPTFPPPPPGSYEQEMGHQPMGGRHVSGQMSNGHHPMSGGQHMANPYIAPQHMSAGHMSSPTEHVQLHMSPTDLSPSPRGLVGGGFGSEPYLGYDSRTPPSFEASPNMAGVDIMGPVDPMSGMNVGMTHKDNSMLFNPESYNMMGYTNEFAFP